MIEARVEVGGVVVFEAEAVEVESTELKELVESCDWLETEMIEEDDGGMVELVGGSVGGGSCRLLRALARS